MAQHISIRVPWHDNDYCGTVCKQPCRNNACMRLRNISGSKDDAFEESIAGKTMVGNEKRLPCISEGGAFMSPVEIRRTIDHPYKVFNPETHGHFLPTEEVFPPYSLPGRPFRWTMKSLKGSHDYSKGNPYNIHYDPAIEPQFGFNTIWVQEAANQREIFNYFYHDVIPHKSLCLVYAKQVPFVDDSRRVIMGIGFVDRIIPAVEYNHTNAGSIRSLTWETMVNHTIRPDRSDGFIFPYRELMSYAEQHPDFDMRTATVFASEEYFEQFSYATEHLSYDAVIDVLLQTLKALNVIRNCIDGNWSECIDWVNQRLSEVWEDRGAFPGIGAMLCAAGFRFGILVSEEIKAKAKAKDGMDVWTLLDSAISEPKKWLSPEVAASITDLNRRTWNSLSSERKALFQLLSRFSLSCSQAEVLFLPEYRQNEKILCSDAEIIANPYILYEQTRKCVAEYQIAVKTVDMAVFPRKDIQRRYPLQAPTALSSDNDERRIRAYATALLEYQAVCGHTVYPMNNLILDMNELPIDPACSVSGDILTSIQHFLGNEIEFLSMKSGEKAFQLVRLREIDDVIRSAVSKRVNTKKRHEVDENWTAIVNKAFGEINKDDIDEATARKEKAAVLKELAEARLSVLIGGAGTGKTTLLSLLCTSEIIKNGGILLLAPTGKARVKMSQAMSERGVKANAKTVAQFLISNGRFDFNTMQYQLSDTPARDVPDTVIIDECSMLTEEMFGALFQALRSAGRIILVGDPNQLPPIGVGRPFVDLVRYLSKDLPAYCSPRVTRSFGELKITRRQKANGLSERLDTELSKWYVDGAFQLDESVFEKLQQGEDIGTVVFKQWADNDELEACILQTLSEELGLKDVGDQDGFDRSLGGNVTERGTYFNVGCAKSADKWQILAPVRNMPYGVTNINHLMHRQFREDKMALAKRKTQRKIPSPMGPENIIYGDKVINIINGKRNAYPAFGAINYVANGEIGIAGGSFGKQTKYLNVEFSSQQGFTYSYSGVDFGEETDAKLELAYALTVHKAQGSEFKIVILVLSEPCGLISKELLYTAITRQTDKLVILYNDEAYHLRNYTTPAYSEIAKRFTNLFDTPDIVEVNDKYFEANLIHRTMRGEMVRSKSEVIIANALYSNGISYEYEKELIINGVRKIPDFTMDDPESGDFIIWEHCGMMSNPQYRNHWENKKKFYESNGIIEGENLFVTYDDVNGSIDSGSIMEIINRLK